MSVRVYLGQIRSPKLVRSQKLPTIIKSGKTGLGAIVVLLECRASHGSVMPSVAFLFVYACPIRQFLSIFTLKVFLSVL